MNVYGSKGANAPGQSSGGWGAYIQMTVTKSFQPLQTMYVTVGGQGGPYGNPGQAGYSRPVYCSNGVGAGGGFSALYDSNNVPIVIAGGGGGGGLCT